MNMKPILFNTEMVRGLLNGTKTVTRRVIKEPWYIEDEDASRVSGYAMHRGYDYTHGMPYPDSIYHPGDILYVRETWARSMAGTYLYRATDTPLILDGWRPSIHMPREAARIFLRVTDVRVERLQDITPEQLRAEGVELFVTPSEVKNMMNRFGAVCNFERKKKDFSALWNNLYAKPQPVKIKGVIHHYESYPWEDIQETRTYRGKPWYVIGNPWIWVIEFERIGREEALTNG